MILYRSNIKWTPSFYKPSCCLHVGWQAFAYRESQSRILSANNSLSMSKHTRRKIIALRCSHQILSCTTTALAVNRSAASPVVHDFNAWGTVECKTKVALVDCVLLLFLNFLQTTDMFFVCVRFTVVGNCVQLNSDHTSETTNFYQNWSVRFLNQTLP